MTRRLALTAAGCAALTGVSAWAGWWKFAALTLLVGVLCAAIVWMIVGRPQSPPSISNELAAVRSGEMAPADFTEPDAVPAAGVVKHRGPLVPVVPPAPEPLVAWLHRELERRGWEHADPRGDLAAVLLDIARTADSRQVTYMLGLDGIGEVAAGQLTGGHR